MMEMSKTLKMPVSVPDSTTEALPHDPEPRQSPHRASRRSKPFWQSEAPPCSSDLLPSHRQGLEDLAGQITEARRLARRLDRSRRYSRRTVALLLDAVWRVTNSAEIVTNSLAIHLAGYRQEHTIAKAVRRGQYIRGA